MCRLCVSHRNPDAQGVGHVAVKERMLKMELDKIVVLCLAGIIFGGAFYLIWKNRQEEKNTDVDSPLPSQETMEPRKSPSKKNRKPSPNDSV
jgi:hypothetical protein